MLKYSFLKNSKYLKSIVYTVMVDEEDFWGDGSSSLHIAGYQWKREITCHKMIMDTWAPLYDNPPIGFCPKEWKIARKLPTILLGISRSIAIDHIDNNKKTDIWSAIVITLYYQEEYTESQRM